MPHSHRLIPDAGRENTHKLAILTVAIAVYFFSVLFFGNVEYAGETGKNADHQVAIEAPIPPPPRMPPLQNQPVTLSIAFVGDVVVHLPQMSSAYDSDTGRYDFTDHFRYVKHYIAGVDLALCNLETTFGGEPYTGFPTFSAPDEMALALKDMGFLVAATANNHTLDKGVSGLRRTLDVLAENGLMPVGSRADQATPRYVLVDVNGVTIGVTAYTYAASSPTGRLLVNGSVVSEEAEPLLNYFRYAQIDEDLEKIKETVGEAKRAGADIVIVYYHWGEEYQLKANRWQRYMAERTVNDMAVDMVFGSHSHTLQEMAYLTREGTDKQVPVFFSMGNFISNQRQETLENRHLETGMIAFVDLTYDKVTQEITAIQMRAVPTWVDKYQSGGKDVFAVIPLDEDLEENETLAASGHLRRAQRAWEDANGILGSD